MERKSKLPVVVLLILGAVWVSAYGYQESTRYLPEIDTSDTLKVLEKSFGKTIPLIKTFEQASKRLDELLTQYKENPTIELEGKLEKELSIYVSRIVELIDGFTGDRDEIVWALTKLERDTVRFQERLLSQEKRLAAALEVQKKRLKNIEKELAKLAREAKTQPENRQIRKEFRDKLRQLRFQERYVAGYRNNVKTVASWSKSMDKLSGAVGVVKVQVADLLDSLDQEKVVLASAIDLRAQRVNIVGQLSGGFIGQGAVLKGLADKIRLLYESIEKFTQVTEEMDINLGEKSAVNKAVSDVTDAAGAGGIVPMVDDKQLDVAIDFYSDK